MKKVFVLAVTVCLAFSILSGTAYALSGGDIIGTWHLESIVMDNQILTPEQIGVQVTMVLTAENKAMMMSTGEEMEFADWRISGNSIIFKTDTDEIVFDYRDGYLSVLESESGVIMNFTRVSDGTDIVANSPVKTDAVIDDFIGAWTAVYIEANGFFIRVEDIDTEFTLDITESTVVSRERFGEESVVGNASCAMSGYSLQIFNDDGSTILLTIHVNNMIAFPISGTTFWLTNDNGPIVTPRPTETPKPIETPEPIETLKPIDPILMGEQWTCASCEQEGNTGKFCTECGAPRQDPSGWTCTCGAANEGKFCSECGLPKPSDAPATYKCSNCGWDPEDPENPPKFCADCGDAFDENDIER